MVHSRKLVYQNHFANRIISIELLITQSFVFQTQHIKDHQYSRRAIVEGQTHV